MKNLMLVTAVMLFLAACAPGDGEQAAAIASPTAEQVAVTDEQTGTALPPSPTAVAGDEGEAVNTEDAEAPAEEATVEAPTETAAPPPEETPVEATTEAEAAVDGRTDDGAYFMGRADAPVRMIDYSDFM
ncbi:MAG: hypothetical protein ACOC9Z_09195 [Chloroflexota bacterium]